MKRRPPITAADLMEALSKDSDYIALTKEKGLTRLRLKAEYAEEDRLLAMQANRLGYKITSVWDFVNNAPHPTLARSFLGPYNSAYPLLVAHLRVPHHKKVREGIIRSLTVKDGGEEVWSALLREFEVEQDAALKWALANALRAAMPYRLRRKRPEIATALKGNAL